MKPIKKEAPPNTEESKKAIELVFLKEALKDYKKSLGATDEKKKRLCTDEGFCHYFLNRHNIEFEALETLYGMYLEKVRCAIFYWSTKGAIEPRIEKLLIAIDKLEKLIE